MTKARYNPYKDKLENQTINTIAELKGFIDQIRSNQVKELRYGPITISAVTGTITVDDEVDGNEIINISKSGFVVKNTTGIELVQMNQTGVRIKNSSGKTIIQMDLQGMSINDNTGTNRFRFENGKLDIKNQVGSSIIQFDPTGMTIFKTDSTLVAENYINFYKGVEKIGDIKHIEYEVSGKSVTALTTSSFMSSSNPNKISYAGVDIRRIVSGIIQREAFFQISKELKNNAFFSSSMVFGLDGKLASFELLISDQNGGGSLLIPRSNGVPTVQPQGSTNGSIYYDTSNNHIVVRSGDNKQLAYINDINGYTGDIYYFDDHNGQSRKMTFQNGLLKNDQLA